MFRQNSETAIDVILLTGAYICVGAGGTDATATVVVAVEVDSSLVRATYLHRL